MSKQELKKNYFLNFVFKTKTELSQFKRLVGNDYGLFVSSFQIAYKKEDIDHVDAKVFSGGVRGLYTIEEGIIMYRSNGKMYAAVISDNIVKYYTNDPEYIRKLPKTINEWRERFREKKVIQYTADMSPKVINDVNNVKARNSSDIDVCGTKYEHAQVINIAEDDTLSVRTGPSRKYTKIDELPRKTMVAIIDKRGKWRKILFDCSEAADNDCDENTDPCKTGWVYYKYLYFGELFF